MPPNPNPLGSSHMIDIDYDWNIKFYVTAKPFPETPNPGRSLHPRFGFRRFRYLIRRKFPFVTETPNWR
jgi:hypothetical protein